jgi:integrase
MFAPVTTCLPETGRDAPERKENAMTTKSETKASLGHPASPTQMTLAEVLLALETQKNLTETRLRDLRSSIKRVAILLGDDPARIPLDVPAISAKLAAVNPAASGLTGKSFSNIRSNFMAAVKASGLKPVQRFAKTPLSAAWKKLIADLSARRAHIGLSRLAHYASAKGIEPEEINDATIEAFISDVRNGTLHRKPNDLHRTVALIWNEAAQQSGRNLQTVQVPSFRGHAKRIEWSVLASAFRKDVDNYLTWCAGLDSFAADARLRALAPQTTKLRQNQIHAAITALVESGVEPMAINSLADVVSPENFKRILQQRHQSVGGRENMFNHDLAAALVQISREWVKIDVGVLAELRRLTGRVPKPSAGLTDKNKRALRQFDDPATLRRLRNFPGRLWAEVKRDPKPNFRTLVKAQAALAVGILSYMPIRLQNLATLTFDVHLFMHESLGATSSLELAASEVKNRQELAYDIPSAVAKMLIEYRNRIAPKIIGYRPDRLFVNVDGTPKTQWTVAWTIRTYLRKRAGIVLSSHQFRHLSAKVLLDAEPGSFETVRQLLGHASLHTTVGAYAGIDSRRAARHHQRLVEEALAAEKPMRRR